MLQQEVLPGREFHHFTAVPRIERSRNRKILAGVSEGLLNELATLRLESQIAGIDDWGGGINLQFIR